MKAAGAAAMNTLFTACVLRKHALPSSAPTDQEPSEHLLYCRLRGGGRICEQKMWTMWISVPIPSQCGPLTMR